MNYPKLNKVTEIPQIAIPRVDEVLDTLGGGSVFSVFDLFSEFTQLTILRVDEVLDTLGGGSVFPVFNLFSG